MNDVCALLYPLGFLSSIAFGARFLFQWIESEKEKKCSCTPLFWKLSLTGNCLLYAHSLFQLHYPMSISQAVNAILSWRNLGLIEKKQQGIFSYHIYLFLAIGCAATTFFFFFQDDWLRSPHFAWTDPVEHVPFWLHVVGIIGIFFYSVRFWVQWQVAEKMQESTFPLSFWWLSVLGALFCTFYFAFLNDWVNLVGPLVSFVPFGRNIWLKLRQKA